MTGRTEVMVPERRGVVGDKRGGGRELHGVEWLGAIAPDNHSPD